MRYRRESLQSGVLQSIMQRLTLEDISERKPNKQALTVYKTQANQIGPSIRRYFFFQSGFIITTYVDDMFGVVSEIRSYA